jgi:hypothetical protein
MKTETFIAIYAAVLSTVVATLQIHKYLTSGVKLYLSLIADGMVVTPGVGVEEKNLIILTVINRGDAPTMITNMILWECESLWQRWRSRPKASYVISSPQHLGYPQNVPGDLEPSKRWSGIIRQREDLIPNIRNGKFYVGITASHRNRPYLMRIPMKLASLPDGTKTLS